MSADTDDIRDQWGSPTTVVEVPSERFTQFGGKVPDLLLEVWQEFGFGGFRDGLWWLCDPLYWQDAVDVWTRDLGLVMGDDKWVAVSRTAFGELHLWGARTGMSLTILPYLGWIFPTDNSGKMATTAKQDSQIYAALLAPDEETHDVIGSDDKRLFRRVLRTAGPVGQDEVYGFVPVPALGGSMLPDSVEIFDATVHLQLLSDLTPRRIMGDITNS